MSDEPRASRHGAWDFGLTIATVALLGGLGVQSLVGTLYAWWAYRAQPGWEAVGYARFIDVMNAVAAPMLVALVLVMGLCVPKRLFARRALVAVSLGMLVLGVIAGVLAQSAAAGITVYLAAAGLIQVAVVALTLGGAKGLAFHSGSRLAKAGSGLLHLGFIVFGIVVVALQDSPAMLPVFWLAAALCVGGSALSFYARPEASAE